MHIFAHPGHDHETVQVVQQHEFPYRLLIFIILIVLVVGCSIAAMYLNAKSKKSKVIKKSKKRTKKAS